MSEHQTGDGEKQRNTAITIKTGDCAVMGEGLIAHVQGPTTNGIRVSDSRGWTAGGDIRDEVVETASAAGIPSHGEHLTLETAEILVRRLNTLGATWDQPVLLEEREGRGVDCKASDTQDPRHPPLSVQVTRPKMPVEFWKNISLEAKADVTPGPVEGAARSLWAAIVDKRQSAQRDVVLALNAIRTPWLALPPVVEAFREGYADVASREGWAAIWVVGADERSPNVWTAHCRCSSSTLRSAPDVVRDWF